MKRGRQPGNAAEEEEFGRSARNIRGRTSLTKKKKNNSTDSKEEGSEEENFGRHISNNRRHVIFSEDEDEDVIQTNPSTQVVNAEPPPVNTIPPSVNAATPSANLNAHIELYPNKMYGDKKDPLYGLLGYHPGVKSVVCVECRIVVHPEHLSHAYDHHYTKLPLRDRIFTEDSFKAHVKKYVESLVVDVAAPRAAYVPGAVLPVVSWLQPPVDGFECSFCHNYCATKLGTLDTHRSNHSKEPGYLEFRGLKKNRQGRKCKVQRFGTTSDFRFFFPVQPLLSSSGDSHFDAFIDELPPYFSLENTLGDRHTSSITTDLPPFLKKVKWHAAIKGYSQRAMLHAVSNPSIDLEDPFHALKPLGDILFSTNFHSEIPPAIAEGLTAYRTRVKPFEVLNDPTSRSSYGREAVRLVSMLCRRRVAGDSSQDEGKGENVGEGNDDKHGSDDEGSDDEGGDDEGGNEEDGDEEGGDKEDGDGGGSDEEKIAHDEADGADSVDDESLDGDYDDIDPDSLDDWEDGLGLVESEPVDDVDEDGQDTTTQKVISDGKDFFIVFSKAQENSVDKLLAILNCEHEAQDLLDAFSGVILDLFTSHPDDAGLDYLHTPLEAFLISRGLSKDGGFISSHRMSTTFSMVQYSGLFSILYKCMFSKSPVTVFQGYKEWVDPDRGTPTAFSTIRRYHRMAYQDCRNYVAPPTIQFMERYGTSFTYKGTPMDIDKLAEVVHDAFKQATAILQADILFGLGKEVLGDVPVVNELDDTSNTTPGYGWLGATRDDQWRLMRHIMNTDSVFNTFFTMLNGVRTLRRLQAFQWLKHAARFKSFIFILIHWTAGMPKRGTEIVKFKIVNLPNRPRNFFWMFGHLAILGLYNKNSSNTGRDHVTLHFLPHAVSDLIFRFYYSVANVERWFIQELYEKVDPHWDAYFFSSLGERWDSDALSKILQEHCDAVMGVKIGLQPFRHVIPAIATHYSIGSKSAEVLSILHDQMGHAANTGFRIYGRTTEGHSQLTNEFCHSSLDFCIEIHKLWGFHDALPSVEASQAYRQLIVDRLSGVETVRLYEEVASLKDQLGSQLKEITSLKSSMGALMSYMLPTYARHPDTTKTQISSLLAQDIMALLTGAAELTRPSSHIVIDPTISTRLVNRQNPESQEAPRKADKGEGSSIEKPMSTGSQTPSHDSPVDSDTDVDKLTDLVAQMASPSKNTSKGKGRDYGDEPSPTRHKGARPYDNMDMDIDCDLDMAAAMARSKTDCSQLLSGGTSSTAHDARDESGFGERDASPSGNDSNVAQHFPDLNHQDLEASTPSQPPSKLLESYFAICPECEYKAFSLLDVVQHFKEASTNTHPKSVTKIIRDPTKKKKFTAYYFRQENMRFECRCCPGAVLHKKSQVEDHIQMMDRSAQAAAHIAAHCGRNNSIRPDWYSMTHEEDK